MSLDGSKMRVKETVIFYRALGFSITLIKIHIYGQEVFLTLHKPDGDE